jgi:hypothetical protein
MNQTNFRFGKEANQTLRRRDDATLENETNKSPRPITSLGEAKFSKFEFRVTKKLNHLHLSKIRQTSIFSRLWKKYGTRIVGLGVG